MPKQKSPRQVAQEQAITYLAHGMPVAKVAEKIGRNKNSVYRWLQLPKFAEHLRFEIECDMADAKRELGGIVRRSIASAGQSLDQLEATRDNPNETSAARDRAAHRLLQHAFKWGEVLDPELSSNDATGRSPGYAPCNYNSLANALEYKLLRAVEIIATMEQALKNSKTPLPENIAGLADRVKLHDYTGYVIGLDKSEILKRKPEDADESDEKSKAARDPEKAEKIAAAEARDRRDAERRAKYRASEIAGTEKPDDIDEEGEVKASANKNDDTPPKPQNSGSAATNVPTVTNVPPVPTAPAPYFRYPDLPPQKR